ncbi:MAG: FKBP-type peptidyl-prolyl cis-trans isomerase, partial [Lachnospiraceae bacterium]|nr:FKBP-type peptidyl-prolyl cis-trans isomerase [Lachnospiraceae bacterium]
MKKRLLAVLLAATTVFSLTACSDENDTFVLSEADLDDYVTLNEDYDIFNVEIEPIDVTDDEINAQINNLILDVAPASENLQGLINRPAAEGDTVVIDYVGTKDGVAFEGGTSYTSTNLTLGSGSFIPGFEDGLIGTNPGDVVTLDLTFPEDYTSAELAGQAVQFEVTVHYILPTYADITEDVVAEMYEGCNTITELREQVSQDIYDSVYASSVEYAVVEMLETKCTYGEELPEALNQVSYDNIMTNLETYAGYYGVDVETYVYLSYYQELETFKNETAWELAEYNTKYLLFCQAYANEKNLNITDEELDEQMENYAAYYGYA